MVILEALNALAGDCLLLRYPGPDKKERLWIIDGGPKRRHEEEHHVWRDVLLPRLKEISTSDATPRRAGYGQPYRRRPYQWHSEADEHARRGPARDSRPP